MSETIKTLRDSKKARWAALIVISLSMFGAYFFNYTLSPLKPMLESMLGWDSADFGIYTSSYTWFNVFLFMLIFSGIILDKLGIRFTGLAATALMALGTGINYWALIHQFPDGAELFGIKTQVLVSALGFGIFGVGTEAAGITVSKAAVKWFKGKEMALAMGMQMSIARLGTALSLGISLPLARMFDFTSPVLLAFVFMLVGVTAFIIYTFMDRKLDASLAAVKSATSGAEEEDQFKLSDMLFIIRSRGFWLIAILCVLFYSAVFPFLFYATDLMINKYHVDPSLAGFIPSLLPFGTMFLTPFFGSLYDRKGKGATIMIVGAVILICVHGVLSIPTLNFWMVATAMVLLLGIGFSLVPAAMWPSVPKIIPEKQLGSAYALIFWIQNIGLWGIPLLLGIVLNATNPDVSPNKTLIKSAFNEAYASVLTSSPESFEKEKIGEMAEYASAMTVDAVVQTTNYEALPNREVDAAQMKVEIQRAVEQVLRSRDTLRSEEDFEGSVSDSAVKEVVPIIEKFKLNLRYDYFFDMLIFALLGVLSLFVGFLLKREDRIKGYGLEEPNIKK